MDSAMVVDIGSTTTKATLWQRKEFSNIPVLVCESRAIATPAHATGPDPIIRVIEQCLDECCSVSPNQGVSGLCFSTFGMSLVGLDDDNEAIAFATYRGDLHVRHPRDNFWSPLELESPHDLDTALRGLDPGFLGVVKPLHPSLAPSHMFTCSARSIPIKRWTTLVSLCLERWTGNKIPIPVSFSEASWWGLFEWRAKKFNEAAVRSTGFPDLSLPMVIDFDELDLRLDEPYARRWTSLKRSKLFLGIVDGACAAVGSSPMGEIGCTVGTSAAVRKVVRVDDIIEGPPKGCFLYLINRSTCVIGGALTDGGSAVDLISTLTSVDSRVLDGRALDLSSSLVVLPFFAPSGERAPGWAGSAIPGAIVGINSKTEPQDIVLATFCGVALRLAEITIAIDRKSAGFFNKESDRALFISGTALQKSQIWQRAVSAATGLGLWSLKSSQGALVDKDETSARGATMIAFGLRIDRSIDCERISPMYPNRQDMDALSLLRKRQRFIYAQLIHSINGTLTSAL